MSAQGSSKAQDDLCTLRQAQEGAVILAGHPLLHHGPTLLRPARMYSRDRTRSDLAAGLRSATSIKNRRARALTMLIERLTRMRDRDPMLQAALRDRRPREIQDRAEGETDYQAIFRYQLTLGLLNLRDKNGRTMPCRHDSCDCAAEDMSVTHIVWDCIAARQLWSKLYQRWTRRSDQVDRTDLLRFSIGTDVPVLARDIRLELAHTLDDWEVLDKAKITAWRIFQAVIPHQLWLKRNAAAFQDSKETAIGNVATVWATASRQLAALAAVKKRDGTSYAQGRALDLIRAALDTDVEGEHAAPIEVRLYYDGGARGNPGPSGAGSLLLERARPAGEWSLVWWAAAYLGACGINNLAEHTALMQGLAEAARRYRQLRVKISVVGDSMLATRQLRHQARTRNDRFRSLITRSRTALLQLYDYDFHHTLRAGNKAADWLASLAMDKTHTSTSLTTDAATAREVRDQRYPRIDADTTHAWMPTSHGDLLTIISMVAQTHDPHPTTSRQKRPRPIALRPSQRHRRAPPAT